MDNKTELVHRFKFVEGSCSIDEIEMISVAGKKHATVDLCIKSNMHVPFASIKLYSRHRFIDAAACFESATALGKEIARRFNAYKISSPESVIELIQDAKRQFLEKNPAAAMIVLNVAIEELAKAD